MKKTIKLIPFFIALSLMLAYGCKKESQSPASQVEPATVEQLTSLSNDYIDQQVPMKALPKWLKVVGADLGGALTGAGIGAGVGSVVPGLGTGAGAIIGGVAGGASASIKEAGAVAPPPNTTGATGMPENISNPYNSVGELHYNALHEYVLSGGDPEVSSSYPYLVSKISNYYNISEATVESTFTPEDCEATVQRATMNPESGNEAFVISLFDSGNLTQRVFDVLVPYARAIDASNPQGQDDIDAFVEYSINSENVVVNSSYLNDSEEAQVLSYMSTARYGMQYWFQYR